jgi:WD40 repeat protein
MVLTDKHSWCVRTCTLLLFLLPSHAARAQTPSPWSGVIRDDAEQAAGAFAGYSVVRQRGMSADRRFLVFDSDRTLVEGDTNGALDVFVRDRQTGALKRVSVATDGTEGNASSMWPAISANGRHVVFQSRASNLLDTGVTSLVTVGPSGERLNCNCALPVARLSGDGRFVVADFGFASGSLVWLRIGIRTRTECSTNPAPSPRRQSIWVRSKAIASTRSTASQSRTMRGMSRFPQPPPTRTTPRSATTSICTIERWERRHGSIGPFRPWTRAQTARAHIPTGLRISRVD